jgi:hypothetical protein
MDRTTTQGQAFETIAGAMYDDRCTIRRRVMTKDTAGGNVPVNQILASDVPVKIRPASVSEVEFAGATQGRSVFAVRLPAWQGETPIDLSSPCFLDIAARGEVEAHTLSVVAPLPSSGARLDAVAVMQS